jgi:hypothetical protein
MNLVPKLDLALTGNGPNIQVHRYVRRLLEGNDGVPINSPLDFIKMELQYGGIFNLNQELQGIKAQMQVLLDQSYAELQRSSLEASWNNSTHNSRLEAQLNDPMHDSQNNHADEFLAADQPERRHEDEAQIVNSNHCILTYDFSNAPENSRTIAKPATRDWAGEMVWGQDPNGDSSLKFLYDSLRWVTSVATLDELIRYYNMRGGADRKKQWLLDNETRKYVCWDPNCSSAKQKDRKAYVLKRKSVTERDTAARKRRSMAQSMDDEPIQVTLAAILQTYGGSNVSNDADIQNMVETFQWIYGEGYSNTTRTYANFGEGGKF